MKKRNIHIHLHDSKWEESKHPRKDDGKFGQGSGGGKKEAELKDHERFQTGAAKQTDPNKMSPAERAKRIEQLKVAVKEDPSDERLANELRALMAIK